MRYFILLVTACWSLIGYGQNAFPFDFETAATTPSFIDFEAAVTTVVANPNINENNPSATVAKMVREPGGQIWAGTLVVLPDFLDLTEIGAIRMKVHAPMTGSVMKMKLEGQAIAELDALTTVANDWEELEWDFTGLPSGVFSQIAIMLDFGLYGDGSGLSTFYFDDVELFDGAGELIQVDLPITHEDPNIHYQTTSFAGNFSELAPDPVDPSNTVMKVTKHWLALDYAGTTVSTPAGLASAIPFEPGFTSMSVDVYCPAPNVAVRMKAEEYMNLANSVETQLNTAGAYEWQTLTFDFSQPVPGTQNLNFNFDYRILSLFFDFGNPGYLSGTTTYYYDNVSFNGNPASVAEIASSESWLFPNVIAASEPIHLRPTSPDWQQFTVYDLNGKRVHTQWIQGQSTIHLTPLRPGIYLGQLGENPARGIKLIVTEHR